MAAAHGARTPLLGAALTQYRGKRSLEMVARRLRDLGFTTDKSTISVYERGRPPDVAILSGLCEVYGVSFTETVQAMADELRGRAARTLPAPPLSEQAQQVARAYDTGPPPLRALLDDAVALLRAPAPATPAAEPPASSGDTERPVRRVRGRR